MIRFEHTIAPSVDQMKFVIEGMRNPLNSWNKSDSFGDPISISESNCLGKNDQELAMKLIHGGSEHRKFLRQMPIMVRITAPLYWWKEFDTYKIGTVRNSCSTMHTIYKTGIKKDLFSHEWIDIVANENPEVQVVYEHYLTMIEYLRSRFNNTGKKKYWYAMIQMLPDGFMMTANVSMNYEVIYNQVHQRKHHKQDEWRIDYMNWVCALPYSEFLGLEDDTV